MFWTTAKQIVLIKLTWVGSVWDMLKEDLLKPFLCKFPPFLSFLRVCWVQGWNPQIWGFLWGFLDPSKNWYLSWLCGYLDRNKDNRSSLRLEYQLYPGLNCKPAHNYTVERNIKWKIKDVWFSFGNVLHECVLSCKQSLRVPICWKFSIRGSTDHLLDPCCIL